MQYPKNNTFKANYYDFHQLTNVCLNNNQKYQNESQGQSQLQKLLPKVEENLYRLTQQPKPAMPSMNQSIIQSRDRCSNSSYEQGEKQLSIKYQQVPFNYQGIQGKQDRLNILPQIHQQNYYGKPDNFHNSGQQDIEMKYRHQSVGRQEPISGNHKINIISIQPKYNEGSINNNIFKTKQMEFQDHYQVKNNVGTEQRQVQAINERPFSGSCNNKQIPNCKGKSDLESTKASNSQLSGIEQSVFQTVLKTQQFSCYLCQQSVIENFIQLQCSHIFHQQCLHQLFRGQIFNGKADIKCYCKAKIQLNGLKGDSDISSFQDQIYKNQTNIIKQKYEKDISTCKTCIFFWIKDKRNTQKPYCPNCLSYAKI